MSGPPISPNNGMGPAAIKVENIVKRYGTFEAVKSVNFEVANGEIFGLLGPNGAGKSTLIRMMTTLIPVTAGRALVGGHDVVKEPNAVRNMIGVIPQAMTSDQDLTVEENLVIYAKLYSVPRAQRKKNIEEVLEAVDLTKWRDAQTKTLSGGMRRRLEIARGLVHDPRIFFLDEPTTGLDPVSRIAVWEMLNNLKKSRNLTMLLTTHYMEEADRLCQRVAVMDHGRILALDTPAALKQSIGADTIVTIKTTGDPARLAELLAEDVEGVTRRRTTDDKLELHMQGADRLVPRIVLAAEHEGFDLVDVSIAEPTLETVFITLTGRELREE